VGCSRLLEKVAVLAPGLEVHTHTHSIVVYLSTELCFHSDLLNESPVDVQFQRWFGGRQPPARRGSGNGSPPGGRQPPSMGGRGRGGSNPHSVWWDWGYGSTQEQRNTTKLINSISRHSTYMGDRKTNPRRTGGLCVYVCVHEVFRIWGKRKLKSQGCAKFWDSRYGRYIKVSWELLEQ
jgi:hypothetical protein